MSIRILTGALGGSLTLLLTSCRGADSPAPMDDTFSVERAAMVREQLAAPSRGIRHAGVLRAMGVVPRHRFVPSSQEQYAYEDHPLPIGYGQTISQPYVVAFMTEQLDPKPNDRVLEIGTGSGYQAAVLAELVREVFSIEIVQPLAQSAEAVLKELNYTNVHVRAADGYQGWSEQAPFDAVIVTCAPDHVPQPLVDQLRESGRMIIPVGGRYSQDLVLLRKEGGTLHRQAVLPVRFVPMTGKAVEISPK